ncbi:hypothetical protein [uncultured Salinicola sp.]|uniref:hypothetical protein n=1 Tax=uncultured Salinicola sp. TaxID=1193542 RepID=UPI00261F6763|nr:hypothetical protein [uncultured Salinicola sp.]|tara:strand:+ start:1181 stop:1705 length:525 start_codon:yes stop_codon:yes gene_type:complete
MNEGQQQARAWFDTLEKITCEDALALIREGEIVPCAHGTIRSTMGRAHAEQLIAKEGARRVPAGQDLGLDDYGIVTIDEDGFPVQIATKPDPVFLCVMPTGWWWSDRTREEDGDYVQLAFLSFSSLELKIFDNCRDEWRERITSRAAEFQSMKGQDYQISSSGQTIRLGYALKD